MCNSATLGLIPQNAYFDREIANSNNTEGYYVIEYGDFVYNPRKSVSAPYGPVNIYTGSIKGIISPLYLCFSVHSIMPSFLYYRFKSSVWFSYVYSHGDTGTRFDRVSIKDDVFFEMPIYMPSSKEQIKIANLMALLDERIATQNKIIDRLQSLIKGIAHKVSKQGKPNIRLSECLLCTSSTLQESDVAEVGAYPVYGANGIVGYLDTYNTTSEAIYIIKDGSGVGAVSCVKGKCSATGTLNILQTKEGFSLRYLYFILKVFSFEPYKTGMAIPHIYFKDYGKAKIYCPSNQLQCKYADLLSKIEQKATAEQKILDNLCSQKQYLLCQMFI